MQRDKDYGRFAILMATLSEATPGKDATPEKVEIYYRLLEDMAYRDVERNALNAIRRTGFFPLIPDIRNEMDVDAKAMEEYEFIRDLVDNFCFAGFGQCGLNIIDMKLKEAGKEYLYPFIRRWGMELAYTENPTATRAQAMKALKHEVSREFIGLPAYEQFDKIAEDADIALRQIEERCARENEFNE